MNFPAAGRLEAAGWVGRDGTEGLQDRRGSGTAEGSTAGRSEEHPRKPMQVLAAGGRRSLPALPVQKSNPLK